MNRTRFKSNLRVFILSFLFLVLISGPSTTGSRADDSTSGVSKEKTFRVGYIEKGYFWAFPEIINAIKNSLAMVGWSDRVVFPEEIHFSPGWEDMDNQMLMEKAERLMNDETIDLIIAAGTPATAAVLEVNNGETPIVSIGVSDPIRSGFVESETDSGIDNYTVRLSPGRYRRMFSIFHEMIGFQKLGLIFYDTEDGRNFSSVDDALEVARRRGFEVLTYAKINPSDTEKGCLEGLKQLVDRGMDAFFQPAVNCFDWTKSDVKILLEFLTEHKIPTFARDGTKYVKAGALMGVSSIDFSPRGDFIAKNLIYIFQGAKPRSLPMVDKTYPKVSVNLETARRLGIDFPIEFLASCDELFKETTLPEESVK